MAGHREGLADRVSELEVENKRKATEYEAISQAHNELKSRYDDAKADNEKLKSVIFCTSFSVTEYSFYFIQNEQILKEKLTQLQNELQQQETRFDLLKTHAETKLDSASEQLVKIRDVRFSSNITYT